MHHSYTISGKTVSWDDIKRYHTSWRYKDSIISKEDAEDLISKGKAVTEPWADIGYHMGVEELTTGIIIVQFGRPLEQSGAHAKGYNTNGYGVCIVGNFDKNEPSEKQWQTAIEVVRGLMVKDNIPVSNVIGHWETFIAKGQASNKKEAQKIKSCPGLKFDMVKFRTELGTWTV